MAFKTKLAEQEIQLGTRQYRIYPEGEEIAWIWQLFGANRFVWNQFVATFEARYKANSQLKFPKIGILKSWLPLMRKEHEWLKRINSTSLQFTVERFSDAMWAFLTKKQIKQGKPRFKSRKYYSQTATIKNVKYQTKAGAQAQIKVLSPHHLRIGRKNGIILRTSSLHNLRNVRIQKAVISYRQDLDRYYISFSVVKNKRQLAQYSAKSTKTGKMVGIDVGLGREWLVTSDGRRFNVPDTFKLEKEMIKRQSHCDRNRTAIEKRVARFNHEHENKIDKYDYANWQKLKKTKSKYQLKIINVRYDYLQKVTTELVKSYDVIAIEDLKVKNLLGNHKLAHNIANASWATFRRLLAYKCEWYGKKLIVVAPQYTSRICSACGRKNPQFAHMKTRDWLAVRSWTCPFCQADHDRDVNASKNILARAIN
ncbi:transposase [Lactobacillus kefiranofaciens]|uniref:RNA-guided endonuclease InsQ/TnpB family protein n=1 Tax=Lactobacillus kefiranofaciens TaxID=267818 RepID=UPI00246922CE|nr:RNA-guided endonuclease TnpB family protein [Lactobacillus kefiranofaciens]MDH5100537.1 transposase [Lactobacillus kefiranofaciens]